MGTLTVRRLPAVLLTALLVFGCSNAVSASVAMTPPAPTTTPTSPVAAASPAAGTLTPATTATPTLAHLIGQKLVVRMDGTTPSASLLGRIHRGEIGGIILFGFNITTRQALIALTARLQAAARAGGQPPLLIAVDQEGGSIKRIPWAPPTLSVPRMGQLDSTTIARDQGAATGSALRGLGINVDFAPVADVPATTASFMYREGRTWSFSAVHTAALSNAFATGLESKGVIPSMKHFPGLGFATRNTDSSVVTIRMSTSRLAPGLRPYRTAIARHIPLIMLSNATYTAYDSTHAAGWSRVITQTLLRHDLGFSGVTITDSLNGTAAARGLSSRTLAVRAAIAGTDMLLLTGSEASSAAVFATLLTDARNGTIPKTRLTASYGRIRAMKAGL
jgi:beta-N-acetylhexosaminidase